jgi:hypothetical protein
LAAASCGAFTISWILGSVPFAIVRILSSQKAGVWPLDERPAVSASFDLRLLPKRRKVDYALRIFASALLVNFPVELASSGKSTFITYNL